MIWAALTVASVLYIANPANFGPLLDPAHRTCIFRMSVERDPVSIILMLLEH